MNADLVLLALIAGAANYAFRVAPMVLRRADRPPAPRLAAFLAAVGPAAIATLATASLMPLVTTDLLPLIAGTAATLAVFALTRAVAPATLLGALAYGLAFAAT